MHAYVFKSLRTADAYVYLAAREGFDAIPAPVRAKLEPLKFVLDVDLSPPRQLAQVDAEAVRSALIERGFYLQVPPVVVADPLTDDHGTDA